MLCTQLQPPSIATAKAAFAVTRVLIAGRGSQNGPDNENSEQVLYRSRLMTFVEVLTELQTCKELSCSPLVTAAQLTGLEFAKTWTERVDGWDEYEAVYLCRANGEPLDSRTMLRLFRRALLAY